MDDSQLALSYLVLLHSIPTIRILNHAHEKVEVCLQTFHFNCLGVMLPQVGKLGKQCLKDLLKHH